MHNKVQVYNQLNPLKEIWIGAVYPEKFYNHFDNKTEDIFSQITEITNRDLNILEKTLTDIGVSVVRPQFNDTVDAYLDSKDNLLKPPICPCDWALVIDNMLYIFPQYESGIEPYQHAIDQYVAAGQNVRVINRSVDPLAWITFSSVVRLGQDIIIDYDHRDENRKKAAYKIAKKLSKTRRVHLSQTGDHNDGVFNPLRPGHIFSTDYIKSYAQTFPGWEVFFVNGTKTIEDVQREQVHHLKWWMPNLDWPYYNKTILKIAEKWLGNPTESIFEVNIIVVDDKNIITNEQNESTLRYFERMGITPHIVNFNAAYFWDAGLHCLSSDIYRQGDVANYWPDRPDSGIFEISEWYRAGDE
jgi:hypothetical protein